MSSIRANSAQIASLGAKCKTEAQAVQDVQSRVRKRIQSTEWDSPAATKFKRDWNDKYEKALRELSEALTELGTAAETMAKNYEATENAYKG